MPPILAGVVEPAASIAGEIRVRLVDPILAEKEAHAAAQAALAKMGNHQAMAAAAETHAQRQRELLGTVAQFDAVRDMALADQPLDERLVALLDGVRKLLRAEVAAILLMDEKGEMLWPRASLGFTTTLGLRPVAVNGSIRETLRTGQPITMPDVEADSEFRAGLAEEEIHSLVAAPIRYDSRGGVLVCGHHDVDKFHATDVELLRVVANQMAAALQQSRKIETSLRARRQAEMASGFKTDLLGMATHEIKTPLTTVALQAHVLADPGSSAQDRNKAVKLLQKSIAHMTGMLDDFLDLSRIQADRLTITPTTFDMGASLRWAAEIYGPPAQKAGLKVVVDAPERLLCIGDERRVRQVLQNLVTNAIHHSTGGTVLLSARETAEGIEVHVRDQGQGMTRSQTSRLFQPFTQVHETHQRIPGTGLGLYISKAIINAHGGRIWLTSPGPGHGTDAAFTLHKPSGPRPHA